MLISSYWISKPFNPAEKAYRKMENESAGKSNSFYQVRSINVEKKIQDQLEAEYALLVVFELLELHAKHFLEMILLLKAMVFNLLDYSRRDGYCR